MDKLKLYFYGLIFLAVAFEVIGDIFFKRSVLENKNLFLYIGLFVYFIGTIFWALSLKYELLSKAITIFTIINLIVIILVGVIYFNENISLINKIGVGVGIISVILMEI